MINKIIILGNHIQALGIARLAAKLGLSVHLFNNYSLCVTRFSNTCNQFILFHDQDDLLDKLIETGKSDKKALLIPTNDYLVYFISKNYDLLSKRFYLSTPDPNITQFCYHKKYTYKKALELNISIPESYFPESTEDINTIKNKLPYPVIIKPAIMHSFFTLTGKKVLLCRNQGELIENYITMSSVIPKDEIIIQEMVPGGAKNLYSYGSFAADGIIYGGFAAHRSRQKPMDFGISSCYVRTVNSPALKELAEKFLYGINYFGFSEVEFMYDERTGEFKMLEINPRFWKWHSIANRLGINMIDMMIRYYQHQKIEKINNKKDNIAWIERITDSYVVLREIFAKRMSVKEYIHSLGVEKEYAVWSGNDPLPALMYLLLTPYLIFKRL